MRDFIPKDGGNRTLSNIIVVITGVLAVAVMYYFKDIWGHVTAVVASGMPFFVGILLAFVQMPIMRFFDKWLNRLFSAKKPHKKLCRVIACTVSMAVLLGLIAGFFVILLPQLIVSVQRLVRAITKFINENSSAVQDLLVEHGIMTFNGTELELAWENIITEASSYISVVMDSVMAIYQSVYHVVFQGLIGLITSFYILMDTEHFCAIGRKISYALFSERVADALIHWAREASRIFSGFISGKVIDSLIIGVLCYIFMVIFGFDYALLISVIIGVTNIIPFFGPFIGAVPSALVLAMIDPIQALWFAVFIICLQQVDGNVIGPLILGDQVGLPAFWIMVSIVCGSALFGFAGMLLGVPVTALAVAFAETIVNDRLSEKGRSTATSDYYSQDEPKRRPVLAFLSKEKKQEKKK